MLLLLLLTVSSARADEQATLVSVNVRNESIKSVFDRIEKSSEYVFLYAGNIAPMLEKKVSLQMTRETLPVILNRVLHKTELVYKIVANQVTIARRASDVAPAPAAQPAPQQQHPNRQHVTGVVTDESGEPLAGAGITIRDNKNRGTISDMNGKFEIDVDKDDVLVISYIGYQTKEVPVKSSTTELFVRLTADNNLMEEVVVTGYGTGLKKPTLTGAISTIQSADIERSSSVATSGALVGKIPGLNFRYSDASQGPGTTTTINIRNMGTPLYVIDGVQQNEGQFNQIDYNDIESIAVLKDASAAIYGLQAANGVIVVTTKKGKLKSKNTVTLNARYGWQTMLQYPRPADAATYVRSYMQSDAITGNSNPRYTADDLKKWEAGTEKGYRPFDWYDYIFRTSGQSYVGANISGGSDKIRYYLGVSNTVQESVVVNYGNFNRTNVQMNVEADITRRLRIGATMSGRIEQKKNPGVPGDDIKAPFLGLYRNLPTVRPYANDNPKYPARTSPTYGDSNFAILNYDTSGSSEQTYRVAQINFNAEYDIWDGLKVKGLLSYFLSQMYSDVQENTYKLYGYDETTDTYPVVFDMTNPVLKRTVYRKEELKAQVQLTYDKKFGRHGISAVVSAESFRKINPQFNIHGVPLSNSIHLFDYQILDSFDDQGDNTEARLGYIGRVHYNYDEKYLLEVSARYDGSWKFPPHHRWGLFPSLSAGWRISEEPFWKRSSLAPIVNYLKVRASYGLLGDDNVSGYSAFDYLDGYNYYQTGAVIDGAYYEGAAPRDLPVTNISWVKAKLFDVGIDFGLFNNRLSGSFDYFRRMRTGLPASRYDVLIPEEAGFDLPDENLESDMRQGVDGGITWSDRVGDLSYSVGGNFTYSRIYSWEQYKPRFSNSWDEYRNSDHHRLAGTVWGYEAIGQFQSWEQIATYPVDVDNQSNITIRPGDLIYKDVNGDKVINGMDQRPVGYAEGGLPILNFGLNFSAQWRGFDLALDFTGSGCNTWTQMRELRVPFTNGGNSAQFMLEDQWHLADPSDASSELIPGKYPTMLAGNSSHSDYFESSFWIHNVVYLKLKNFELGYTLPESANRFLKSQKVRFYLSAENLFYLANIEGIDPEVTSNSGVQYPTTRLISLGFNIKF
jgi:TonB-linked SusC/RagA family outer membrane protein